MLQALMAGVASIKAQQTRMNVIGNNLANINTTAYKGNRVTFQEMMSQTVRGASRPGSERGGTNPVQFGLGVLVGGTDTNISQGSLNATNRPTDFAVQGNGLFMLADEGGIVYTRDGNFVLDAAGNIVHAPTGRRMLGWTADPETGLIDSTQPVDSASALLVPLGQATAVQQTTQVTWTGNLDARSAENPGPPAFPAPGYRESTVRVFDSLGDAHDITLRVIKTAANTWYWEGAGGGGVTVTGSGTLTFDPTNGTLLTGDPGTITVTPPAGALPFDVSMDFGTFTQLATDQQVQASNQNGFPPGSLQAFSVGQDGVVTGLFTNGLTRALCQISMAVMPNIGGMERLGNNLWRPTDNSGIPVIGEANSGGRGSISAGFLEQSNVDIGQEFTDLIVTQRGFQANTRVVTTVDEMLEDLINMKR